MSSCWICGKSPARRGRCPQCQRDWVASPESAEADLAIRKGASFLDVSHLRDRFEMRRRQELGLTTGGQVAKEQHVPRKKTSTEGQIKEVLEQLVTEGKLMRRKLNGETYYVDPSYVDPPMPGVAAAEPVVEKPKEEQQGELGPGQWAIIEVMGHKRLAGLVRETTLAGEGVLRVDVPEGGKDEPAATQFIHPKSLYALTPCTEEMARAVSKRYRPEPVATYELRQLMAPKSEASEDGQIEEPEPEEHKHTDDCEDFPF